MDNVYETLRQLCIKQFTNDNIVVGANANEIANLLKLQRSNTSSDLNKLYKENRIEKVEGKPVLYKIKNNNSLNVRGKINLKQDIDLKHNSDNAKDIFEEIVGAKLSLKTVVQQARAAIIYPPNGLHTLILGETGTGKSMFAETMYKYAKEIGKIKSNSPFVTFNCADYASNPQLLMAQLFGVKKGAYTGAEKDRRGIVEKANEGILFLDEVHRLPPEGQEMLFYLIDKGIYRRFGEPNIQYYAKVLIICATTENVESSLLKTFTRRVPMVINLPALKDRTIDERYRIIKRFFEVEATCIKSDISVTSNSLKALLLYDCSNNIGQLKSDIKLCCAKAFLENMINRDKEVCVHSEDLPEYVLRGAFRYKEHKDEIDKFLSGNVACFSIDGSNTAELKDTKVFNFYEALEEKRMLLEYKGLDQKDIKIIMSLDIDTYLKKYILNIDNKNLEELYKVVDKKIVNIVEEFLRNASESLHKEFSTKIFCALSMHLASTIERITNGKNIKNHQLEDVKLHHSIEFNIANMIKEKIKYTFNIVIPEDEVGFITMFLCMDEEDKTDDGKVAIIVAMHGESAATSIVDVANRLLGEGHAVGYNMPLDQKAERAFENLLEIVKRTNRGKGVILLVDMGSLVFFGDMIYKKTKIPVRTIEMVSTPTVLEATRKALLNYPLDEVYESCTKSNLHIGKIYKNEFEFNEMFRNDVILTACVTGKGAAVKLKSILKQKIDFEKFDIDIIPIEISDKIKFKSNIEKIKKQKNVLAVVSAIDPKDEEVFYISTSDVLKKEKIEKFSKELDILQTIDNMREVIKGTVDIDEYKYIENFKKVYIYIINSGTSINENILLGLILHLACAVEHILHGKETRHIKNKKELISEHHNQFNVIKKSLKSLESAFGIVFLDQEYVNVMKIVYFL